MRDAISLLVERGVASGAARPGIEPLDLLRAIAGVAKFGSDTGWEDNARKLVEVLTAGIRATS